MYHSRRGATPAAMGPEAARRGARGGRTVRATAAAAVDPGGGQGKGGVKLPVSNYSNINIKHKWKDKPKSNFGFTMVYICLY